MTLQRTSDDVAPREMVPSLREQSQGAALPDFVAVELAAEAERPRLRDRVIAFVKETDPRETTRGETKAPIVVFALVAFLQGVAAGTVTANILPILNDLQISIFVVSIVGILTQLVGNLTDVGFGFLGDRVRRTVLGLVIGVVGGASYVILGLGGSVVAFVAYRFVQTIFGGFGAGASVQQPMMADYYRPEVRGRVFSSLATMGAFGGVVGPLIGGVAGDVFGWRTPVIVLGVVSGLAATGYLFLREPSRGRYDRIRLGASEQTAASEARPPGLVESFRASSSIGTLRRVWFADIFSAIGGAAIAPALVVLTAQELGGGSPALFGLLLASQAVGGMAGLAIGGTLVDRLIADRPGRIMIMIGGTYLVGLAVFVLMALRPPFLLLLPVLLVVPVVTAVPQMAKQVLLSLVVPARFRGFGIQSSNIFGSIGLVLVLIVLLALRTNDLVVIFIVGVPPLLIAAILYMTASTDVAKDMENARIAVLAEEEMAASRKDGKGKLLVCRQVDVHYDGVQVLFGVDFDVDQGELVALLGTNGAGKSTLLRAISGLSEPTGGAVFLDGRDVTHTPPHELASFGVVQMPGGKGVFPALTVTENLRTAGWLDTDGYDERLAQVYELFPSLLERSKQLAGTLSGGEQQMVAIGQALIMRPKILLIDELSLGLAPAIVEQLLVALEAIRDAGTTIILVEQSVNLALTVADRAVFMEKGEIRFSGPTEELMRRPDILRSVYLKGSTPGVTAKARREMPADRSVVLSVKDVSVAYGGVKALSGASLEVASGEIVGIVGPNGAGKTTLFDAVSGFVTATTGEVLLAGTDISGLRPDERARRGLARSFQDARLFGSLTVVENIQVAMERQVTGASSAAMSALWLPQVRKGERRMKRRAESLIELLGLGDFRDKFVSELSTGSRRVVDLACVMATDPEVLLLDEPSSGIAQAEAEELGPLLQRIRRDVGCGLLVIEHDIRLLSGIADRLVGMVRGETIVEGDVDHVLSDPVLVAAYLGTSERVLARSGEPAPPSVSQSKAVRSTS